jgi:hypothetical protein
MAKKTRTELSTLALNTNLPDNTTELITPTTERSQLTDERESVVNYKDDFGGVPNAGKFLTVAIDGESLTMVDEPSGVPAWVTFVDGLSNLMKLKSGANNAQLQFFDADGTTLGGFISWNDGNSRILIGNSQTGEQISMSGNQINLSIGGVPQIQIVSNLATFAGAATFSSSIQASSKVSIQRASGGADTLIQFKNEVGADKAKILFGGTNEELSFYAGTGATEHVAITSGGVLQAKYGISFPNQSAGSGTVSSSTLDAYEEGTWTPVIKFGTSNAETHYTPQAIYTRIGRVVYIQCTVANITKNGSGDLTIEGLPFPVGAVGTFGNTQGNFRWGNINLPTNGTHIDSYLLQTTSKIAPQIIGTSGYISGVSNTFVSATTWEIYGLSAFYMI